MMDSICGFISCDGACLCTELQEY